MINHEKEMRRIMGWHGPWRIDLVWVSYAQGRSKSIGNPVSNQMAKSVLAQIRDTREAMDSRLV